MDVHLGLTLAYEEDEAQVHTFAGWFAIDDVGQWQKKIACRYIDTVRTQVVARTVNQDFIYFGFKSRCRLRDGTHDACGML
jgi:hypothetical protein